MSRLTRDRTAKPVLRDQILRRERGQGNIHFPCPADHEQDWQPYAVGPYYWYMCVAIHTYIHNADKEIFIFSVQLTTSRIGNLTRLIHTYMHTVNAKSIVDTTVYSTRQVFAYIPRGAWACLSSRWVARGA